MAHAIRLAVEAGALAREAGRIPRRLYAEASTPMEGVPELHVSRRPRGADRSEPASSSARRSTASATAGRRAWAGGGRDDLALCCTVDVRYEDPLTDEIAGRHRRARPTTSPGCAARSPTCASSPPARASPTARSAACRGGSPAPTAASSARFPPTGKFVTMHGVHYVELRDGLICRARGFFDLYDAAMQLGLLPKRGSLGESALLMLRGFGLRSRT